jgi:molybdopterin converting factor subunit 1
MQVKLRYFASLRERLGKAGETREIQDGATVGTVWHLLTQERPELRELERSVAFAVAQEYVDKDHPLQDNDELAFIPPVSGGVMQKEQNAKKDRKEPARILAKITQDSINMQELTDFVADPGAGAMNTFVGTTRNTNEGREVVRLEYECYPGMAEKEMAKIGEQALERWPILKIAMIHRLGRVDIGEASVAIAVSSSHRHAAFEACHYAINTLKETVPIWKKELYEGGQVWIGSQTGTQGSMHQVQEEGTS